MSKNQQEFLKDNDDDIPDDDVDSQGEPIPKKPVPSRVLTEEQKKQLFIFEKIYKMPTHKDCKNHLFCEREHMSISYHPDSLERNPCLPAYLKKDNKNAEEQYIHHLKQPFYFKNIMEKKALYKEGIKDEEFQDDGQLRYGTNAMTEADWLKQSDDLARKIVQEKKREQIQAQKKQIGTINSQITSQQSQMEPHSAVDIMSTGSPERDGKNRRNFSFDKSTKKCCGAIKKECCQSMFHFLQPKPLVDPSKREKSNQPITKMQKLQKQTQEIDSRGQQIIDSAIKQAMIHNYAPKGYNKPQVEPVQKIVKTKTYEKQKTTTNSTSPNKKVEKQPEQPSNKEFLHEMNYRYVHEIEAFNEYAWRSIKKQPTKNFNELKEQSSLIILQQSDLEQSQLEKKGLMRKKQMSTNMMEIDKTKLPDIKSSQQTPVSYSSKKQIKFLDPKSLQIIEDCRKSLNDQKLYAETILVNARTGKQLKPPSSSQGPKKPTTFQQYQGNIFSQTSNQQIAKVLNHAKRYEWSQMQEDFGIMRYIKKKYYQDMSNPDTLKNDAKFQEIKQKYFKEIEKDGSIFDQIQYVNQQAKNIYKDVLKSSQGLNSRDGKMEVHQYMEQNLEIAPNMIGQGAVKEILAEKHQDDVKAIKRDESNFTTSLKTEIDSPDFKSRVDLQTAHSFRKDELSVKPSKRNIDQASHIDSHSNFKPAVQKSVQQVYLDSDYWYHKGVVLNQMQENEYALNCYKQALKLNRNHKASIFNLACAYEKLMNYEDALEWFSHAIKVQQDWPDAHYGLALCCLKLKRNNEAVQHIENATKWSIEDYKIKMRKRRRREELKRIELQEAIAKGNASPKGKSNGNVLEAENETNEVLCPEDNDSQDELYVDPATKKNEGVSTHIMYVRALCHREVKNYRMALESYAKVMKREHEISDYEKMIEQLNFKDLALKNVEGPGFPGWRIDIYSHFKRNKLLKENNRIMMVDLTKYYVRKEGWLHDKIPNVIIDLQRIRFFNRFDRETLYQMMKKTDLRVVNKHSLLFLEPDQCAIIINGNLNMFSHKHDVAIPILQAVFTPGDIIGNAAIDKGWSRDTHSWIIAYQDCDILVMNIEYVNYLWDKMKCSKANFIAEQIKDKPWFRNMSEQSIYTIAYDVLYYQKFDSGQKICPQAMKSQWNVSYIYKQKQAVKKFLDKNTIDPEYQAALATFNKENNCHWYNDLCIEGKLFKDYQDNLMRELNRRETLYGKKVKKKSDDDDDDDKPKHEDNKDDEEPPQEVSKKDQYTLGMPKFETTLTEEQLLHEKKVREARQPFYAQMVKYSEQITETNNKVSYLANKMIDQTEEYRQNKQNLLKDYKGSEGIFILLEGSVTVKNDFNVNDPAGVNPKMYPPLDFYPPSKEAVKGQKNASKQDKPELYDVMGAERFLQVQGYSYYGSIYSTCEGKGGTTCGYMKEESLYLIPFYDLYQFKEDLEKRYAKKCGPLFKKAKDEYQFYLKKM